MQALEGEGAIEVRLDRWVRERDRALGGFERLRYVGRLVGLLGPHEVGRGEVALQARVCWILRHSGLQGLDGAGGIARHEIGDPEGTERLGRAVAIRLFADARHGPEYGR